MEICYVRGIKAGNLEREFYLIRQNNHIELKGDVKTEILENTNDIILFQPKRTVTVHMDAVLFSLLESALQECTNYRLTFFEYITNIYKNWVLKINVNITVPQYQMIDKRGNKLFENTCLERRELDHALAWFSTLGGGFSALGDTIEYCAIMAGKISQQQFLLALKLDDPNLVARCKLYLSLSLIQQKKFAEAKPIIKSQFLIAKQEYERDKRLMSMCLGIWTKLKYDKRQAKLKKSIKKSVFLK